LRFIHIKSLPFEDGPEKIERMLKVVAEGISRQADVAITNIFINHRPAHSGWRRGDRRPAADRCG
jgi:hypothetical protein